MNNQKVKSTGQKLRIILDWIVFDLDSHQNNFAMDVREAFISFIQDDETNKIKNLYNKIQNSTPDSNGKFVFWKENKEKCLGAIFLHAISLHFNTENKNGKDLIIMGLNSLIDGTKFNSNIIKNMEYLMVNDLELYGWCTLIKKINLLNDQQFSKLSDDDMKLNFNFSDELINKFKKDYEEKIKEMNK